MGDMDLQQFVSMVDAETRLASAEVCDRATDKAFDIVLDKLGNRIV
jgi:hypothetical protein